MPEPMNDIDALILKARAEQLAKPAMDKAHEGEKITLLEFEIMGDAYAVELHRVEAVTRIGDIFSVPLTPAHIPGVIRRQGQTLALVCLERFFYPSLEGIEDMDFAIIVNVLAKRFAIQTAEITGVFNLEKILMLPPPDNFDHARAPYLTGITSEGMLVLDLERIVRANGFGTQRLED